MANYLAASPKKEMVDKSLTDLYNQNNKTGGRLKVINTDFQKNKFIIFSDQHKGNKSWADDFDTCETNFLAALGYYNSQGYNFINLGDCEELWKFKAPDIIPAHKQSFVAEAAFPPERYFRAFGNHDLIWKNKVDVDLQFKNVFNLPLPVYEGILLTNTNDKDPDIFLTHGHQGDQMSDNNAFSTWIVAHLWTPVQRYLRININSPSDDHNLRNKHNKFMYEWSSKERNTILITGHTHQPVFASGRYFDHPSNEIHTGEPGESLRPSYFNTGCCCFNDGDITGIEIADGFIRLIKWYDEEVGSKRKVLEEIDLVTLVKDLSDSYK